jgi:hypothetical protein
MSSILVTYLLQPLVEEQERREDQAGLFMVLDVLESTASLLFVAIIQNARVRTALVPTPQPRDEHVAVTVLLGDDRAATNRPQVWRDVR